jgi:hypothetical protein
MAETWFTPKEWKARLVEFAGRRLLRNVANGESTTYDVSRSEGQVSQEGDAFNTKNMNDLERRISNGFAKAKTNIDSLNDNGAIKGMDAREDGVYITYSTGADTVTKKLGSEPQLLGTLTGNGTFDCKKIANYKQLTKDNFFIIPKTVRARFNAPGGTDSSNMGWNSTKELKSIEYNADTGILSFYLTTSDSYSYGNYWTKSYSIDITGDLYCVF